MKDKAFALCAVAFAAGLLAAAVYVFLNQEKPGVPTIVTSTEAGLPEVVTINEDEFGVIDVSPPQELDVIMVPEDRDGKSPEQRCDDMAGEYQAIDHTCYHVDY